MLECYGGTPTWRLHTGLCKFVQNISTNIWSLGKRKDLFISYHIIISWRFTLNCDSATQELGKLEAKTEQQLLQP